MSKHFLAISLLLLSACGPDGVDGWFVVVQGRILSEDGEAVDDAQIELVGAEGEEIGTVHSDAEGIWGVPLFGESLSGNVVQAKVTADGFAEGLATFEVSLLSPDTHALTAGPGQTFDATSRKLSAIILAKETAFATVSGRLVDAATGAAVPNLAVSFQRGWNAPLGAAAEGATTADAGGHFTFDTTLAGAYTVSVNEADGYAYTRFPAFLSGAGGQTLGVVTPPTEPGQIRASVVWTGNIDLDLHLTATRPDEQPGAYGDGRFHLWAGEPVFPETGDVQAAMDRVAEREGPETLSVWERPGQGDVAISVVDNTNLDDLESTALAGSGAVVQVWFGEDVPRYFTVAPGEIATFWQPMREGLNAVTYVVETYAVGVDPWDVGGF